MTERPRKAARSRIGSPRSTDFDPNTPFSKVCFRSEPQGSARWTWKTLSSNTAVDAAGKCIETPRTSHGGDCKCDATCGLCRICQTANQSGWIGPSQIEAPRFGLSSTGRRFPRLHKGFGRADGGRVREELAARLQSWKPGAFIARFRSRRAGCRYGRRKGFQQYFHGCMDQGRVCGRD